MKLLLFYVQDFWMRPARKSVLEAPEAEGELSAENAVLAMVHAETADAEREAKLVTKAIKQIKWVAGKFDSKRVVLHYFAHLDRESAPAELAQRLVERMAERLEAAGYQVTVTPFGYFTEFKLHVDGASLAKVYVEL
jgi:hypothetical protein